MKAIKNVCVIDDDEIFVYWIKKMFDEIDFAEEFTVHYNGSDAIIGFEKMIEKGIKLPDIIFIDLNMPIMTGWDFLDEFLKLPKHETEHVLVYIVSSSIAVEDLERAKQYDIIHNYVPKPISPEVLVKIKKGFVASH